MRILPQPTLGEMPGELSTSGTSDVMQLSMNELISQLSNQSRRGKRWTSQDFIDDDNASANDPEIDGVQSNKKRRDLKSEMP